MGRRDELERRKEVAVSREVGVAGAYPIVRWRGWRPGVLSFEAGERGGQVWLVLDREGDLALLPCAEIGYIYYAPVDDDAPEGWQDFRLVEAQAPHRNDVLATVRRLENEGWRVVGRLEATFTGLETERAFWDHLPVSDLRPAAVGEE
jgi:hypothetical protein